MTHTPGEGQTPEDPASESPQGQDQPGYWEQQSAQQPGYGQPPGQQPYGQAPYGQAPYGQAPYGPAPGYAPQAPMQYAPDHPKSTMVLVLGILGIVICGLLAPFAWWLGRRTLQEIDASNGALGGRGAANAGYVLGIVGTVLLGLGVVALVAFFGIAVLGVVTTAGTSY